MLPEEEEPPKGSGSEEGEEGEDESGEAPSSKPSMSKSELDEAAEEMLKEMKGSEETENYDAEEVKNFRSIMNDETSETKDDRLHPKHQPASLKRAHQGHHVFTTEHRSRN